MEQAHCLFGGAANGVETGVLADDKAFSFGENLHFVALFQAHYASQFLGYDNPAELVHPADDSETAHKKPPALPSFSNGRLIILLTDILSKRASRTP